MDLTVCRKNRTSDWGDNTKAKTTDIFNENEEIGGVKMLKNIKHLKTKMYMDRIKKTKQSLNNVFLQFLIKIVVT